MSDNLTQSVRSAERSISSAAQKEASAFLYICQMSLWWMGKSTMRCGFSWSSGSGASPLFSAVLCFEGFLWIGGFLGVLRGMGCLVGAEFVPVVSVVADKVGDFMKSLVQYGHVLV